MSLESVFLHCSDLSNYIIVEKIGRGNYGKVAKIRRRDAPWNGFLALKTFRNKFKVGCGVDFENVKEVLLLKNLKHENVIKMIGLAKTLPEGEVFPRYSIILEFCNHDLEGLLVGGVDIPLGIKKNITSQILEGLRYLFSMKVLHRDLKPSNILLPNSGIVKIADFGMGKLLDGSINSIQVTTIFYRAPEVILGDYNYDQKMDMWAVGCILAQMWTRDPLLVGENETQQLTEISKICGPINSQTWPDVYTLPYTWLFMADLVSDGPHRLPHELWKLGVDKEAADMIDRLLVVDPSRRMSVFVAMEHPFVLNDVARTEDLARLLCQLPQQMLHQAVYRRVYDQPESEY